MITQEFGGALLICLAGFGVIAVLVIAISRVVRLVTQWKKSKPGPKSCGLPPEISKVNLAPCPLCYNKAVLVKVNQEEPVKYTIKCTNCQLCLIRYNLKNLIKLWNRWGGGPVGHRKNKYTPPN